MSFLPSISVIDGVLRENETIELYADFTGDIIAHLHPHKHWMVFNEKNVKYDEDGEGYYYDSDEDGVIYKANDVDNIQVKKLKPGRLFVIFQYTTYFGEQKEVIKTFIVKPISTITLDDDITTGDSTTFTSTCSLNNVTRTWTFSDDGFVSNDDDVTKSFDIDGYYDVNAEFDYTDALHADNSPVVWHTTPTDRLAGVDGPYGGGTMLSGGISGDDSLIEDITGQYLVKYNLADNITININFSQSVDNTIDAPLNTLVTDESEYDIGLEGDNRIEYVEINYGDRTSLKTQQLNIETTKVYKRSGEYYGNFTVYTIHDTITGPSYRQSITKEFYVTVSPFFTKWLKDHLNPQFFNSVGFNDLATAWGVQMDRVYNEAQILIESIDIEKIDNKFLAAFAETYGDFPEIYKKVGFVAFSEGKDDRFQYLEDYNFFDRIKAGDLSNNEKKEFINYMQRRRIDLQKKGTVESIERTIARFALTASIVELWVESYKPRDNVPIIDRVFGGEEIVNNTGIRYRTLSTPLSNNIDNTIINSKQNSYIEINTYDKNSIQYYTKTNQTKVIDNKTYIVFTR